MTSLEKLNNSINALAETLFPEPYKGELGPLCDAAVAEIKRLKEQSANRLIGLCKAGEDNDRLRQLLSVVQSANNYHVTNAKAVYEESTKLKIELQELENWKRQALIVLEELDLQAIGKELNLPIGESVSKQMLPKLKEHKETVQRVLTVLKDIRDEYRALDLPYGSKPYADATALINDLEYPK